MCRYCKKAGSMNYQLGDVILLEAVYTIAGEGDMHKLYMSYCPACGRHLDSERKKKESDE